jgi:D-2-hydroxyacid dehydrogenase (NADP+)
MKVIVAINDFNEIHKQQIQECLGHLVDLKFVDQFIPETDFLEHMNDAEIVAGWPKAELINKTTVKLVQIGSSGWDAYENKGLEQNGIRLCNAKGIYSIGVAEVAIGMMFALTRNFNQHWQDKSEHKFQRHEPYGEIAGSTACILGLGEIGSTLAQKCHGLDMRVLAVDHFQRDLNYIEKWYSPNELPEAVSLADHVFVTISGESSNKKLISRELLSKFKAGACFYNMSRGTTVDQAALIESLKNGKLNGAGLDVTDPEPPELNDEIYALDNVFLSGHSGGLSGGWKQRLIDLICTNVTNYIEKRKLINELDWTTKRIQ